MEDYYEASSDDEYYNRVYDDDGDVNDLEETHDPLSGGGGASCQVNWSCFFCSFCSGLRILFRFFFSDER